MQNSQGDRKVDFVSPEGTRNHLTVSGGMAPEPRQGKAPRTNPSAAPNTSTSDPPSTGLTSAPRTVSVQAASLSSGIWIVRPRGSPSVFPTSRAQVRAQQQAPATPPEGHSQAVAPALIPVVAQVPVPAGLSSERVNLAGFPMTAPVKIPAALAVSVPLVQALSESPRQRWAQSRSWQSISQPRPQQCSPPPIPPRSAPCGSPSTKGSFFTTSWEP